MTSSIKRFMITTLLMLSVLIVSTATTAAAESNQKQPTILSIQIEGNQYMDSNAVLARLHSKVGQQLDRRQLSRDVQRLYRAGFFSDIRFSGTRTQQGIQLICHVKEFPLIAHLKLEGNKEHKTKDLLLRLKLLPGRIFNPINRNKDLNTLLKGYLKDGYYQISVDFIPTELADGRIDLLIRINEGSITRINRIHMIGNTAFSDSTLRNQLASKQPDLFSSFSKRNVFDQRRFGADGQLLQQYYMNHGFLDMSIQSKQIVLSEDKKTFSLTFSLHEGKPYTISKLSLQGDVVPDKKTLQALITLEKNNIYALDDMKNTIAAITERIGDEGYAFATVTPLLNRNIDNHTVSIIFDIEKGEEVYIERIQISGNDKSDDAVVRRLITQSEGSRYSGSQIKTSKAALGRAPFVKDLRISTPKTSASDKVNMNVILTEKRTGSISGGVGFSQREKVILTAKISESNLFGKGYQASLNGQYGRVTQDISASFTDPYLFGTPLSLSLSAFVKKTDPLLTVTFRTDSIGGSVGLGVPFTPEFSYGISYRINSTNILQVPTNASLLILSQIGKQTVGELIQSLTWDSRNRFVSTTNGHVESISFGFSGLGGNSKFWETSASSQAYFPFDDDETFILNPSFSARMIKPYAKSATPLFRRYSLGGIGSMRGFDSNGISLRDPRTGEALGGDKQARASINLFFPPPFSTQTSGIRGLIFADAGIVWGSLTSPIRVIEPFSLSRVRYTAGFGIEWLSPVGPIGLSWAFPIKTVKGDIQRSFEFALGSSF